MQINFSDKMFTKKYHKIISSTYNSAIEDLKPNYDKLEVSIIFVTDKEIREINRDFRDKDAVTDVISFPLLADESTGIIAKKLKSFAIPSNIDPATKNLNMGDIYICLKRAKEQALEYGHSLEREVSFLALHGLLHLFGFDHIDEYDKCLMRLKEEEILSKCGTNIRMEDEISLKERKVELKKLEKERNKKVENTKVK